MSTELTIFSNTHIAVNTNNADIAVRYIPNAI